MRIGLYTETVRGLPFEAMLDLAAGLGIETLEIATGGQSRGPHLELERLLRDAEARCRWREAIQARGLALQALNCSAFPLHPRLGPTHQQLIRDTIRLAALLELDTIVTQSGCPGDSDQSRMPNWIVSRWPPENLEVLEWQWQKTIALWRDLAAFALEHGVRRIAFELHPVNMVYNVPTLLRLREAVGPVVGATLDPSQLVWQGMDVHACVRALESCLYHVQVKDARVDPQVAALAGVLDTSPVGSPLEKAWGYRVVGRGHDELWWRAFLDTLRGVGYQGSLSIEGEHELLPGEEGLRRAVAFLREVM